MPAQSLNYFTNLLDIQSNLRVYYDFDFSNTPTGYVKSISGAQSQYSGIIKNYNISFSGVSGSGYFNGNDYIQISGSSGLHSDNWTMLFNYEKLDSGHGVLFSNYQGDIIKSGFAIGVNNANKLYLESYDNNGPVILESSNVYGAKNGVAITKAGGAITFGLYDFNSKELNLESFFVNSDYFLPSNDWFLGNSPNSPTYYSGRNFSSGYLDDYLYFDTNLLPNQQYSLFSGFFLDYTPETTYVTQVCNVSLSGYITGRTPIFSGTTGTQNILVGYLSGSCGNTTPIYSVQNKTGIIYENSLIVVSGNICNTITGISGARFTENTGYSLSFGMDGVSYIKNVNASDLSELYYFTNSSNKTNINKLGVFDRAESKVLLSNPYNSNQLNLYTDSVAQFCSGFSYSGNIYNLGVSLSGMCFLTGNYVSGDYDGNDVFVYDIISGFRSYSSGNYFISGSPAITGLSGLYTTGLNSSYFLDGVKLKSGLDYRVSSNTFILSDSNLYSITGKLFSFPIDTESSFTSGVFNYTGFTRRFAPGTSILYMNGMRQKLNEDYIELSKLDLLYNSGAYPSDLDVIYNNGNDFMESFT